MDTSLTTLLSAFVLGGALAAGLVAVFLNSTAKAKSKAKKKQQKKPEAALNQEQQKQQEIVIAKDVDPEDQPQAAKSSKSKKSKQKKVKNVQIGKEDVLDPVQATVVKSKAIQPQQQPVDEATPFPALNPNNISLKKKGGKADKATSYAFVAQSEPPVQKEPAAPTPSHQPVRAYEQPSSQKSKQQQIDLEKKEPIFIPKPTVVDSSSDDDEDDDDSGPAARVLKINQREELEEGWVRVTEGASTKKAPTLRLVSSKNNNTSTHSFPVKPAPPPVSQLTKTQLNNQRKAEKLRQEKEAARIVQEHRKQEYRREAAAATAKEKAIAETMKHGAALEKQRLAAVAALEKAAKLKKERESASSSSTSSWEAADSGSSFWD